MKTLNYYLWIYAPLAFIFVILFLSTLLAYDIGYSYGHYDMAQKCKRVVRATRTPSSTDFCRGFRAGYRSIKGPNVVLPVCPVAPASRPGETMFDTGVRVGVSYAVLGM